MNDVLLSPPLHGLAIVVILEGAHAVLRRVAPRLRLGWPYHAWAVCLAIVVALAESQALVDKVGWQVLTLVALALTAIVVFDLLDGLLLTRPWRPAHGPIFPKLVRDLLRVSIVLVVTLAAAVKVFNLQLPAVLVSSTLLSAAIGFALQDVLKNVFAGIALQIEKPFDIGDWLLMGAEPAQVEEITWRSTRLRTNEGVVLHEPNANLSSGRVVNYGSGKVPVAFPFRVGLGYDAPPAVVKQALLAAVQPATGVAAAPQVQVFVEAYGDSAVTYHVRAWTREVHSLPQLKDSVNSRIWYQLQRAGLTIPYPIRTVHLKSVEREQRRVQDTALKEIREVFERLPLFENLPQSLDTLASQARRQYFDDGEVLVREGDGVAEAALYIIERGRVTITKRNDTGTARVRLGSMSAGEFFGEMSLLTGAPRSATVTADGPVQVLVLARTAIVPLLTDDPLAAEALSNAHAEHSAGQVTRVEDHRRAEAERADTSSKSLLARIRAFFSLR